MQKKNVHKIIASNIELLIFFAIIVAILLSPFLYINLFESPMEDAFGVELLNLFFRVLITIPSGDFDEVTGTSHLFG